MTSTRVLTIVTFIAGSAGLVMVSQSENLAVTISGGMLVVAAAILFARHFWRESDRKRKQELASYERTLREEISRVTDTSTSAYQTLTDEIDAVGLRIDGFTRGVLEYIAQLELDQQMEGKRLNQAIADNQAALLRQFTASDRLTSKSRDSVVQQLTAVQGLYHRFKPVAPYPPFGGWAIGGECAHLLVSLVLIRRPNWIVEAGSGLSTILAGHALDFLGDEGRILSMEHDTKWLERSAALVEEHGLSHRVTLVHAPLVDTKIGREVFLWYDLQSVALPEEIDLIFIDGPPQGTGPLARYPAVPVLFDRLVDGGVILMDDATRQDERDAIERWQDEFPELEFQQYADSKGTVEITKTRR